MHTQDQRDPVKEVQIVTAIGLGAIAMMVVFCAGILLLFLLIPFVGLSVTVGIVAFAALAMLAYMWPMLLRRRQPAEAWVRTERETSSEERAYRNGEEPK